MKKIVGCLCLVAVSLALGSRPARSAHLEAAAAQSDGDFQGAIGASIEEIRASQPAPRTPATKPIVVAGWLDDLLGAIGGGNNRGGSGGSNASGSSRGQSCKAYDDGWEEHSGGHGGRGMSRQDACAACKGPGAWHGGCRFECTEEAYRCTAEWVPDNSSDRRQTYEGSDRSDERDAEDNAMNRCRDDNWRRSSEGRCRAAGCRRSDRVLDSGHC